MNPTLAAIFSVSMMSALAGAGYILDCRLSGNKATECWLTGLPIMGIGGAAGGGFKVGYETYNPKLRKKNETAQNQSQP